MPETEFIGGDSHTIIFQVEGYESELDNSQIEWAVSEDKYSEPILTKSSPSGSIAVSDEDNEVYVKITEEESRELEGRWVLHHEISISDENNTTSKASDILVRESVL